LYPFESYRDALIRACYRVMLGREVEEEISAQLTAEELPSAVAREVESILDSVFNSEEAQYRLKRRHKLEFPNLYDNMEHKAICFIHLEKTGGKTLDAAISDGFAPDKIFREDGIKLYCYSPGELSVFKYITGHYDYYETLFIPAVEVVRVAMFRHPLDRLISFYRYHRAHDAAAEPLNPFVALARSLEPEAFFRHPTVRSSPRIDNAYLHVFGANAVGTNLPRGPARDSAFERAWSRIASLDAVGLTHRMGESVECIFRAVGLKVPETVEWRNRWMDFEGVRPDLSAVGPVSLTPKLRELLADLIDCDDKLYALAETRFEELKSRMGVWGSVRETLPLSQATG